MTRADSPESVVLRQTGNAAIALERPEDAARRKQRLVPKIADAIERASKDQAIRRRRKRIAAWVMAAAMVVLIGAGFRWYPWPQAAELHPAARLASAHGVVTVTHEGKDSPARAQSLVGKDGIRTSEDGGAVVLLGSGTRVELAASTKLTIGSASPSERVTLAEGRIEATVPKLAGGASFEVVTPDSLVQVHGTRFAVTVGERKGAFWTRVDVTEGLVAVHRGHLEAVLGKGASWSSLEQGREAGEAAAEPTNDGRSSDKADEAPPASSTATATARVPVAKPVNPGGIAPSTEPPKPSSSLTEENALFQRAMQAAKRGDDETALALLETFLAKYPDSLLAQNALVERFRTLRRLGRAKEASREARKYMAEHPEGFASDEARDVVMPSSSSKDRAP